MTTSDNIYGTTLFKRGETIYDPETDLYVRVKAVRAMTIYGLNRIFYQLDVGEHLSPEARWREHSDVMRTRPKAEDYIPTI